MAPIRYCILLSSCIWLCISCTDPNALPKSAKIPVTVQIDRFDQAFFSLHSQESDAGLNKLMGEYPDFLPQYLQAVLGIDIQNEQAGAALMSFLQSYKPIYEQAQPVASKYLPQVADQMETALQRMAYLIPDFKPDSPFVITTFIGPMDAYESFSIGDYGDVRTVNGVGIALQLHLGGDHPAYDGGIESGVFYQYQVRRFEPETMVVNAVKNLIEDRFPYAAAGKPLIEEMVEKGKRMCLLQSILPDIADSLLIGYTGNQLEGSIQNEALIWQFFVKNDLLFGIDPSFNNQFIKDGPKTPELGEASPGYIGLFTGWRIVQSYLQKNKDVTFPQLMGLNPNVLFQKSGYKPK